MTRDDLHVKGGNEPISERSSGKKTVKKKWKEMRNKFSFFQKIIGPLLNFFFSCSKTTFLTSTAYIKLFISLTFNSRHRYQHFSYCLSFHSLKMWLVKKVFFIRGLLKFGYVTFRLFFIQEILNFDVLNWENLHKAYFWKVHPNPKCFGKRKIYKRM